jgi:hypothetical protein
MDAGALCPRCNTRTVVFVREDPPDIRLHRCTECGQVKRSCPACGGQGWLDHYTDAEGAGSRYVCDECLSAWDSTWMNLTADGGCSPYEPWGRCPVRVLDFEFREGEAERRVAAASNALERGRCPECGSAVSMTCHESGWPRTYACTVCTFRLVSPRDEAH